MKNERIPHCQNISNIVETVKISVPITHKYMTTHFAGVGTGTSIKSGVDKLVLYLDEMSMIMIMSVSY